MNLDAPLLFANLSYPLFKDHLYPQCNEGSQVLLNMSTRFGISRFVARHGEWSLPWDQDITPECVMPAYDPVFSKTFGQVTDDRAIKIRDRIRTGEKFAVMYSGGTDSTLIMSALVKNLTNEELSNVVVCSNVDSIIENPRFWERYVYGKLTVVDSSLVHLNSLIREGFTVIQGDEGDAIFGTVLAIEMYNNYDYLLTGLSPATQTDLRNLKYKVADSEVHYSKYKDIIIKHLSIDSSPKFGELLYHKYVHNINTSEVPVQSLHDFFWWGMFSVKYVNCVMRQTLFSEEFDDYKKAFTDVIGWFATDDYQRWAMVNNNNGQKIRISEVSYKHAATEYIYEVDNNRWYRNFKIKLNSGEPLSASRRFTGIVEPRLPYNRLGLTNDYEVMWRSDPTVMQFFTERLLSYQIDWPHD